MRNSKYISIDERIMMGSPTIRGTRIATSNIYSMYRGGHTVKELSMMYGYISIAEVQAAIRFEKNRKKKTV